MWVASAALLSLGIGMMAAGAQMVVGFLRRSRHGREPNARPEVGPWWTQRAVLGALLVTAGFFFAVFGALLTFAPGA